MSECREAFERNECEKYGNNYDDMKKNWDWYESQYGWRYPEDSPRGMEWKAWEKAWDYQQSKVDELQKRIDGIKKIIREAYESDGNSSVEIVFDEVEQLEQALKGGGE